MWVSGLITRYGLAVRWEVSGKNNSNIACSAECPSFFAPRSVQGIVRPSLGQANSRMQHMHTTSHALVTLTIINIINGLCTSNHSCPTSPMTGRLTAAFIPCRRPLHTVLVNCCIPCWPTAASHVWVIHCCMHSMVRWLTCRIPCWLNAAPIWPYMLTLCCNEVCSHAFTLASNRAQA